MASSFALLLWSLIGKKYESRRAFVRAAEPTRDEDSAQSYLSKVLSGSKPPPLDRVEGWARALDLEGPEKERFLELAELAHAPERIARRYLAMQSRLKSLEKRIAELEAGAR